MIDLGPHGAFIVASFAVTGIILGWLIAGSLLAARRARLQLERLERRALPTADRRMPRP